MLMFNSNISGTMNCGGTYLDPNDYFVSYFLKHKTDKEEILEIFRNEINFDEEDRLAASKEIRRLEVKKQRNFYDYYASKIH